MTITVKARTSRLPNGDYSGPIDVAQPPDLPNLPTGDKYVQVGDYIVPDSAIKKKADGTYDTDIDGRYIITDVTKAKYTRPGETSNFFKSVTDALSSGKQIEAFSFNSRKHIIQDGKVYTVKRVGLFNDKVEYKEMEGVVGVDPAGRIIIDKNAKAKADADTNDGIDTNGGNIITTKEAPDALKAKENESFGDWETRMQKYASYALYLGLGIVAITTVASFINWLKGDTDAVNNEVFRIKDIKREGKITYTSQYKICAGDTVYGFAGFVNVNRAAMDNKYNYTTGGGVGSLDDSSQTFEEIESGVTVTPPSGQELTFRVETTALRRLSCALANVARDLASGAANVGKNVAKGFWEGLGIDPVWLIGGIILLIILAIVASVFLK